MKVKIDSKWCSVREKPHIHYSTWIKAWVCSSEHGPWNCCIGAGENVVEAYKDWERKKP